MSEVKWIKLATDVFNNRKIRQIEGLPDGDSIIVIWMKILCLAGNINDNGLIYFTKEVPYTEQMITNEFNRPLATVQMAFKIFQQFEMIEVIDDVIHISNWEKYQNVDRMAELREYNRIAKQKSRKKLCQENVNDKSMTSQRCQDTDIDKDIDKNKIKNKNSNKENKHKHGEFQHVLLSDADLEKWQNECPVWETYIQKLDEYLENNKSKHYANHLLTMRTWYRKEVDQIKKSNKQSNNDFMAELNRLYNEE